MPTCVVEGEGIALHPTAGSGRCRPSHLQGHLRPGTSPIWPSVSLTPGKHLTHPGAWIQPGCIPTLLARRTCGNIRLNWPCELTDAGFVTVWLFCFCFSLVIFHFFPCCNFWRIRFGPGIIFVSLGSSVWILDKCFLKICIFYVPLTPPLHLLNFLHLLGFPGSISGKERACQCRRHNRCRFDPWVGKIPWRRAWQSTPVFLSGGSHGQRSL